MIVCRDPKGVRFVRWKECRRIGRYTVRVLIKDDRFDWRACKVHKEAAEESQPTIGED